MRGRLALVARSCRKIITGSGGSKGCERNIPSKDAKNGWGIKLRSDVSNGPSSFMAIL